MFVDAGCHGLIRSCFGCGSQMDRWGDYDLTMWSLIYCQLSNLHFQKDNRWTFGPLLMWHQCSQRNFCSLFLRHTQTQTHTLLGENERCVCQSNANPAGFFLQVTADVWLTPVRPYLSWWQSLTTLHGENASRRQTQRLTLDISVKVPVIVAGSLVLLCVSSSSCPALLSCYCYSSCFRISYMSFGCFLSYFEGLFSYTCCSLFLDVGFWSILL